MKKILLVEDDKALQKLIVYNFQKEGFNIETVSDGEEVIGCCQICLELK